jgi:L-gulonolactone oxidase
VNEPASESDVADIVARASKSKRTVKAVGAGHSFTATALTNGHLLNMKHLNKIIHVDREKNQVTVEAGIHISELN